MIVGLGFSTPEDVPVSLTEIFAYTLSDGSLTDTANLTLTIVGTNDAPMIDLNSTGSEVDADRDFSVTDTEDAPPVLVAAPIADALDLGENDITRLTIVTGGITDGAFERVAIADTVFPLNVNGGTVVTVGGTNFVISYTAATGTFVIEKATGTPIAQADLDTLLRSITYENTDQDPVAGDRTLTITARDVTNITSARPSPRSPSSRSTIRQSPSTTPLAQLPKTTRSRSLRSRTTATSIPTRSSLRTSTARRSFRATPPSSSPTGSSR